MQYLGGKTRIAKQIAAAVNLVRGGRDFWDPFCGGLSVAVALGGKGVVSDGHPVLISLYQAVAAGWSPPEVVTEDDYRLARALHDSDPRKAFIAFACSFGGKWFAGYARSGARNFAASGRVIVMRDVRSLTSRGCEFHHLDFLSIEPRPTDLVLYLDPPYKGTTGYSLKFDHGVFYRRVAEWARYTDVFVSEYAMPWGRLALEFTHTLSVAGGCQAHARTERLYHYGPSRLLDAVGL